MSTHRTSVSVRRSVLAAAGAMALSVTACGGGSSGSPSAAPKTTTKTTTKSKTSIRYGEPVGPGPQWPTDVCAIVDDATTGKILAMTVSGASPSGQKRLCNYEGTFPGETKPKTVTAVHYYNDDSEWKIHLGNLPVREQDKIAGLGKDAFQSGDGIWVLLADGRMFIADVAYGVKDGTTKEMALTKEILTHT